MIDWPWIFVPKNKDYLDRVLGTSPIEETRQVTFGDRRRYIEYFLPQDDCDQLEMSAVFDGVNAACGTLISSYEEDQIVGIENLQKARQALLEYKNNPKWPKKYDAQRLEKHLDPIIALVDEAIQRDTGIFFFL